MAEGNRRRFERLKHRLACDLFHSGRKTSGMILDVSARGLFVRTSTGSAPREPGTEVRVVVRSADGEPFELMARLARAHVVRRELVSAADGGFGLEITSAPEAWFALLRDIV